MQTDHQLTSMLPRGVWPLPCSTACSHFLVPSSGPTMVHHAATRQPAFPLQLRSLLVSTGCRQNLTVAVRRLTQAAEDASLSTSALVPELIFRGSGG